MSEGVPSRLNNLLSEGEIQQEQAFYRLAGLVKSRDNGEITRAIGDVAKLRGSPLWSKYLRASLGSLKTLLCAKKDILTTEFPAVPFSTAKARMTGTLLGRQLRNSAGKLVRKRYRRPVKNDYEQRKFVSEQVLTLKEKLELLQLPKEVSEKVQRNIGRTVEQTIRNCGEFVTRTDNYGSRRNLYIQQVVENTLVLESFYRGCLSCKRIDQRLLETIRKELCAVHAYEDFVPEKWLNCRDGVKPTSVTEHVSPAQRVDSYPTGELFSKPGLFSGFNEELNQIVRRLKEVVARIGLLNKKSFEQCPSDQAEYMLLGKKHEVSGEMVSSLQRMTEFRNPLQSAHLPRRKTTNKETLQRMLQKPQQSDHRNTVGTRSKLLCTSSAAIRPCDIRSVNLLSMHNTRKSRSPDDVQCQSHTFI